jgi:DNA-directed RNA polymerase specialized sigma24 family protein
VCLESHTPYLTRDDKAPPAEELAKQISAAVMSGRLSVAAAQPVFLTRVAGYSTVAAGEQMGHSAAVVRALRSRAERALVRSGGR